MNVLDGLQRLASGRQLSPQLIDLVAHGPKLTLGLLLRLAQQRRPLGLDPLQPAPESFPHLLGFGRCLLRGLPCFSGDIPLAVDLVEHRLGSEVLRRQHLACAFDYRMGQP